MSGELVEIHKALSALNGAVGEIKGTVTATNEAVRAALADRKDADSKLEVRLRKVEAKVHYWSGASFILGAIATWFAKQHVTG